jgi:hypothetical protein
MVKHIKWVFIFILLLTLASCASDEVAPVFSGVGNVEYTIGDDEPNLLEGISALDDEEGDLTSAIVLDDSLVNYAVPGTYEVTITVSDSSGNTQTETFNVVVLQERLAPVISGANDLSFERGETGIEPLEGVEAFDNVDGDLTSEVVFDDSLVNYDAPGTYDAFYRVTDAAGNEAEVKVTVTITGLTDLEIIQAEIAHYRENQMLSPNRLNLNTRQPLYNTLVIWDIDHEMIMSTGIMLDLAYNAEPEEVAYTGTFKLNGLEVTETFYVTLNPYSGIEIAESRVLPFTNITTEYDVADGELALYFAEGGEVPYVFVPDFLTLIQGFIDPSYEITVTETETTLTLFYQYYDEEEDYTYDLEVILDSVSDTITTNDPGFYWAYVSSTETNYGRHINYVDMPDEDYQEGSDIVYELAKYRMDIVSTEEGILIPFYIANQLFAGSSYYNVYYNYDGLFGIYSLPDFGTDEFTQIRTSSKNNSPIPDDLIVHNFDMLTFSLDYFYGLRQYLEIETFYELTMARASTLLNPTARTFDTALRDLLLKDIDEPHTSYGYASYYNRASYEGPAVNTLSVYGTRFNEWYNEGFIAVDDQIEAKWGREGITSNAWAAGSLSRPMYWFLDEAKTSVVVTLDSFRTSDIEEDTVFNLSAIRDVLEVEDLSFLPAFEGGSKYFYYKNSTETELILEVLVKGLDASYLDTYKEALASAGYTYVVQATSNANKKDGYYQIAVGETQYMLQVGYDTTFNLFYVSVANSLPEGYEEDWPVTKNIVSLVKADSAVYMEEVLENVLNETEVLANIMLDITWNTGGNVGALYRVVGFITSEPFMVSRISGDTGSRSSSYVQIDGVPQYDMYNWALLTSPLSFSAANSLATIFKYNNLGTVIGLQTGGGASSITPILLPVGSAFTMSSNSVSAFRTGSGTEEDPYLYFDNEFGIAPDIEIDITELFDNETLLTAFLP